MYHSFISEGESIFVCLLVIGMSLLTFWFVSLVCFSFGPFDFFFGFVGAV